MYKYIYMNSINGLNWIDVHHSNVEGLHLNNNAMFVSTELAETSEV